MPVPEKVFPKLTLLKLKYTLLDLDRRSGNEYHVCYLVPSKAKRLLVDNSRISYVGLILKPQQRLNDLIFISLNTIFYIDDNHIGIKGIQLLVKAKLNLL